MAGAEGLRHKFDAAKRHTFCGVFAACFRVARASLSTISPREVSIHSLHLNYRNDCVIFSRALISSRQGGYMVHAARAAVNRATARFILRSGSAASKSSAPAPLSPRHFLIASRQNIKNRANSLTTNEKTFSNR